MTIAADNPAAFVDFQSSAGPYTITVPETAGDLVQVAVFYDRSVSSVVPTTIELTSSPAKTFSAALNRIDDIGDEEGGVQFLSNTPSPGGNVVYTVVFKNNVGTVITNAGMGICVAKIAGSSGYENSNSAQANTVSLTPTTAPALICVIAMNAAGSSTPTNPAGYTTGGSGATFGSAQNLISAASLRVTTTAAQNPVSTGSTLTFIAAFAETAGAAVNNAIFFGNVA